MYIHSRFRNMLMMPNNIFDFEKPIFELESKLEDMRKTAEDNGVEVASVTTELEQKIQELKENIYSNLSRWQKVQISRHPERPYTLDYISHISTDFVELHGDRNFQDDKAMIGGIGRIDGKPVMLSLIHI